MLDENKKTVSVILKLNEEENKSIKILQAKLGIKSKHDFIINVLRKYINQNADLKLIDNQLTQNETGV